MMVALSFTNPFLLGGMALASLPIIIHLLNRRRFKQMEWAAMDFLLKAAVRNRKRVRLENLLLLLLRTLIVVLLILAVARPFTKSQDALASMFGSDGATERIIVLDDSHSMRAGQGNRSAFEVAKQLTRKLINRLYDERSDDRITLILASDPHGGVEGGQSVAAASENAKRLADRLARLKPSDGVFDVASTIDAILETLGEEDKRLALDIVSDFRRRDWTDADGNMATPVSEAMARFTERGEIRLVDVGTAPVNNLGVVELESKDRAVVAGVPTKFVARIKNHGPDPIDGRKVQVTFQFGETRLDPLWLEGTLQPGETAEVTQEFTFRKRGPIVVQAKLPTEVLPGDDTRRLVVHVRKTMRFLLVDGEPDPEAYRGETDFLAAALMPPGNVVSGIEVEIVTEQGFHEKLLETADGVFLLNVYRLPTERLAALEEYVRGGGGLVFFLGDQIDPAIYNATFYGRGDDVGKKLLPLLLRDTAGSSESYVNINAPALDHPVVRFLRGINQIVFRTVAVGRYIRCEETARGAARVILTLADDDGSPFLAEKSFGDGRVLLFTTSADLEWSNFPHSILYLAIMQEAARYIVRPDPGATTLTVATPIVIRYDPKRIAPQVAVVPPAELGGAPVKLLSAREGKQLFYRYERTLVAGTYTVRLKTPAGEDFSRPYVFNVDPTEGDLQRANLESIRRAVPGSRVERAGDESALDTDESDRTEFWRTLVYCLLAIAALETLLAWRFGHHSAKKLADTEGKQVFVR